MAAVNGNGDGDGNGINGHTNGHTKPPLPFKDSPIENLRPLRVIVIGAGFSGICAAIRIPEKLRNIDLTVYEKNEGLGGVWWLNRYPGIACDLPSHTYQYSFAPNPHWSNVYAPGPEIQQYLEGVAQRFGATRFIKTSHRVDSCVWDEAEKKWHVTVTNLISGETFEEVANVVITARGQLNEVSLPDIPGLSTFKGKVMHSAEWDKDYDFKGKRVGVIGNGSSAIQIIPQLQKVEGLELTCFMRSPTWISPPFADNSLMELGLDPAVTAFSPELRQKLADDPEAYLVLRKVFENGGNMIHDSVITGTPMQEQFTAAYRASMAARLAARPDLLKLLLPSFAPGCRRLTPGIGFLEALQAPNVTVLTDEIASMTEDGATLTSGATVPLDALICATGFQVSEAPPFPIVGRGGVTLAKRWGDAGHPESYLSVALDGFPNLLALFGPNSSVGFGSLCILFEAEVDYAVAVLRKLQKEDYACMEPKAARVADFMARVGAYFKDTVYVDTCKSWYRSDKGRGDWICALWPGSPLHKLEALRSPRWEDWEYESLEPEGGNLLRWLGNGFSLTQLEGDPSWYINPNETQVPFEGKPEENPRFKARPWSY